MDNNPLFDIAEKVKQQRLDENITSIKKDIESIMANNRQVKLIELRVFQDVGSTRTVKEIFINPDYITFIAEDGSNAYVHLTSGTSLHTVESHKDILNLIEASNTSDKSYIG